MPAAAESVAVLNRHLGQHLDEAFGVSTITLGTLTDEDREATTAIAEWLREQVLDDGEYAAGIRAHADFAFDFRGQPWLDGLS